LDWSYRIKQAGWKIMYCPNVKIIHFKKRSGRAHEDSQKQKQANLHFYQTMEIFYKKHYIDKYPRWLTTLIFLAINLKRELHISYINI